MKFGVFVKICLFGCVEEYLTVFLKRRKSPRQIIETICFGENVFCWEASKASKAPNYVIDLLLQRSEVSICPWQVSHMIEDLFWIHGLSFWNWMQILHSQKLMFFMHFVNMFCTYLCKSLFLGDTCGSKLKIY